MESRIILGIGSGRCGTRSLADVLNRQPGCRITHEDRPLLAWDADQKSERLRARFARWRQRRSEPIVGDDASLYLPYLDEALSAEPDLRVICLQRPRDEVIDSFGRWLDRVHPVPTDHWTTRPQPGRHHHPVWSTIFPKYDEPTRQAGIGRYYDDYYRQVARLQEACPDRVGVFPTTALNDEASLRDLLSFAGIPADQQVLTPGTHLNRPENATVRQRPDVPLDHPSRCVVLVPYGTHIVPACEQSLKELERRGYVVRRVRGYAAIDQGRNQMATDALVDGFTETIWIDSDVGFQADDVEKIRRHKRPIICGICPKKAQRALAVHVLPGTEKLVFGQGGGLTEILYAGTGFLHVRREAYEQIQLQQRLPVTNEAFGKPLVPFFEPMTVRLNDGNWSLAEDYSFCERARRCGYEILADTTIRLHHIGNYAYTWEDAGLDPPRYATFHYHLGGEGGNKDG
jgi:hypothetical protein